MNKAGIVDVFRLIRFTSAKKWWNYCLVLHSYLLSRLLSRPLLWGMPAFVTIEPGNRCNLNCIECPVGQGTLKRSTGDISLACFDNILSQCKQHTIYLSLYFQGEPLLHPHFFHMVQKAKKAGLYVDTSTNGHLLDSENAHALVNSGIDRVIISFDGPDQEVYSSYRKGGEWNKVVEGVRHLVAARREKNIRTPYIILQCLLLKGNADRKNEVRKLARELGADKLQFKTIQLLNPEQNTDLLPGHLADRRYSVAIDGTLQLKRIKRKVCRRIFTNLVFTSDGRAVPCCYDKDALHAFGGISDTPLRELWQGDERKEWVARVIKSRGKIAQCNNCPE